jgi:hypothetical protein
MTLPASMSALFSPGSPLALENLIFGMAFDFLLFVLWKKSRLCRENFKKYWVVAQQNITYLDVPNKHSLELETM